MSLVTFALPLLGALELSRHCLLSLAPGDDAEPGSGARIATCRTYTNRSSRRTWILRYSAPGMSVRLSWPPCRASIAIFAG